MVSGVGNGTTYPAIRSSVSRSDGVLQDGDVVQRASDGRILTVVFTTASEQPGVFDSRFVAGFLDLRAISDGAGTYGIDDEFVEVDRTEILVLLGNPARDEVLALPPGMSRDQTVSRP